MRLLGLGFAFSLLITGCSIPRVPDTAKFYEQEAVISKICLSQVNQMPPADRLKLDPLTGRSPFTTAAWCYSGQMQSILSMLNYPHADIATNYANHLVQLSELRDKGIISNQASLESYRQITSLFKGAIANADKRLEEEALKEVANRLVTFGLAMSGVYAARERQAYESLPVTCRITGVYAMNSITCSR